MSFHLFILKYQINMDPMKLKEIKERWKNLKF